MTPPRSRRRSGARPRHCEEQIIDAARGLHRHVLGNEHPFVLCDPRRRGTGADGTLENHPTGMAAFGAATGGLVVHALEATAAQLREARGRTPRPRRARPADHLPSIGLPADFHAGRTRRTAETANMHIFAIQHYHLSLSLTARVTFSPLPATRNPVPHRDRPRHLLAQNHSGSSMGYQPTDEPRSDDDEASQPPGQTIETTIP